MTFPSKVISPLATLGPLALSKVTKGPKRKFDVLLMDDDDDDDGVIEDGDVALDQDADAVCY